jgi:glycosyltransferase involved in cell wall biosynthesis
MSRFLVVLVPARNAAGDLPGLLDSIRGLADAVVALDDGSTDGTREVLAAEPLVEVLLTNPRREDYRGWDDAANRNRLLEAAAALEPEWILSLDADERIDAGDAAALRAFLETDALPGCAYGFRHVPMRGDVDHYLPRYQWVYRLFACQPGQRFPDQRLHFVPVPTSIPRSRWIRTT